MDFINSIKPRQGPSGNLYCVEVDLTGIGDGDGKTVCASLDDAERDAWKCGIKLGIGFVDGRSVFYPCKFQNMELFWGYRKPREVTEQTFRWISLDIAAIASIRGAPPTSREFTQIERVPEYTAVGETEEIRRLQRFEKAHPDLVLDGMGENLWCDVSRGAELSRLYADHWSGCRCQDCKVILACVERTGRTVVASGAGVVVSSRGK